MKILQINTSDTGGGAEKVAWQIHNGLNKKDIISDFLVGRKKKTENNILQAKRNIVDKVISKVINQGFNLQGIGYFGSLETKNLIESNKYDLVHYHNIHGEYYNIFNVERNSKLVPAVWTLHDMWSFTGRCAYAFDCSAWQKNCGECGENLSTYPKMYLDNSAYMYRLKKKLFTQSNIRIVTPSKWLEDLVRESFMKNMDIRTIYNGVDTEVFSLIDKKEIRNKYNLEVDRNYILFLSADINTPRKGFKYLVEALNKIDNKKKYTLLIVGKNIEENYFDKNFEIHQYGYITDERKLNELYAIADIFMMPTLADNFPCTVIEAMASGTPVISFDIGGIKEQISQNTGWLVPPKDTDQLARSIERAFSNKSQLSEYGINARKRILDEFSLEKSINEYIALYREILN